MDRRKFLRLGTYTLAAALLPRQLVLAAPRPTVFGVDQCPYCNMTVVDLRFSAQVVTHTGLVLHYDATECLADHLVGHGPPAPEVAEVYLADYLGSDRESARYLSAKDAIILAHARLRTPMGGGLAAFADAAAASAFAASRRLADAELLSWEEVLARGKDRPWVPDY